MKKTVLLATSAIFALSVGTAMAAAPATSSKGSNHFAHNGLHHKQPGKVLWDQTSDDSGVGIVSQNFESSFDIYDAQGADDFVVPEGSSWKVTGVNTVGLYFNGSGPARDEHVTIYKDKHGKPGKVVADYDGVAGDDNFGSYTMSIPKTKLKSGTYWVSVVANMDFGQGGESAWETSLTQTGNPAQWQNPGDGFGSGCTTWGDMQSCIGDLGEGPDFMFQIVGK